MIILLNKIKPKKLSDILMSYVFKDKIVLDFGTSTVVCYGNTGISSSNPIYVSHKDLYNNVLENAISKEYNIEIPDKVKWNEIIINSKDNSYFSSISGVGEDLFWLGKIQISANKRFSSVCYGLNYKTIYVSEESEVKYSNPYLCDYTIFYYLFQLTKHISGKKTEEILISDIIDNKFYITNKEKEYYIICNISYKDIVYKNKTISNIDPIYEDNMQGITQFQKKSLIENNTLFRTLSRPLGDIIDYKEFKLTTFICGDGYKLWMTKYKT